MVGGSRGGETSIYMCMNVYNYLAINAIFFTSSAIRKNSRTIRNIHRKIRVNYLHFYLQIKYEYIEVGKTSIKQIAFIDFYCLRYFSGDF